MPQYIGRPPLTCQAGAGRKNVIDTRSYANGLTGRLATAGLRDGASVLERPQVNAGAACTDSMIMQRRALAIALSVAGWTLASACASTGARPQPFPTPPGPALPPVQSSPIAIPDPELRDGYSIARTALAFKGVPYRSGGTDPRDGFDCSGLVQYVFALHGLQMPRVVRDQFRLGRDISLDALEPGDLVFFRTEGRAVSHVGIVLGGEQFIHAPNSRGTVRTSTFAAGYWGDRIVGARRVD